MSTQFSALLGVLCYEFRMQVRRRAVWITLLIMSLFLVGLLNLAAAHYGGFSYLLSSMTKTPLKTVIVIWTNLTAVILPIGFGCLLADRLARDRRTKVEEVFTTLPAALSARLIGKYLGSVLATIIPIFAFYCLGLAVILYQTHNLQAIPLALAAFATIVLPGLFFVGAFSLACPAIMWVPLYQFLFTGYWFWGNLLRPSIGIPTLSGTILTPIGGSASQGFFGDTFFYVPSTTTALQGSESILLMFALVVLVIAALWTLLKWRLAHA